MSLERRIDLPDTYIDGIPADRLRAEMKRSGKRTRSTARRFWSSVERPSTSTVREVVEIRLAGPRLINYVSLATARFPHTLTVEYLDDSTGVWYPLTIPPENPRRAARRRIPQQPVRLTITHSQPAKVNLARRTMHPQHFGAEHWEFESWKVSPVTCARIRVVMERISTGEPPRNPQGQEVPYSLGLRDWQVGYRVHSKDDVPKRHQLTAYDDTEFSSSIDLLGSRVTYTAREQRPRRAIDNNPATAWRSEPQPVNYAVVNFYADAADDEGNAQVIDRFYVEPLSVGAHVNLYYSSDEPDSDFDAVSEDIPYPMAQSHGATAARHHFPQTAWGDAIQFSEWYPSYVQIENSFLRFDPRKNWWLAWSGKAFVDYTGQKTTEHEANFPEPDHPWMSFGQNILRQNGEYLEFITDTDEVCSLRLPPQHRTGSLFNLAIVYRPNPDVDKGEKHIEMTYQLGGHLPIVATKVLSDPILTRPSDIRVGGYPDDNDPGVPGIRIRGLMLKQRLPEADDLDWFFDEGPVFVADDEHPITDRHSTRNALLRIHPMFSTDANIPGIVGGPGDRWEHMEWTPIAQDYTLKQGLLHVPPTRARYWKFEFTKLVPEHYEVFVPIRRTIRMHTVETVRRYQNVTRATRSNTMANIDYSMGRYADALNTLRATVRPSSSGYSPTEALYVRRPDQAERVANQGWIWQYQPWHLGQMSPRFITKQRHIYETIKVNHKTKVGYFAGIKTLRAYRLDHLVDNDTPRYLDHFDDDDMVESANGFSVVDGALQSQSHESVVHSKTMLSRRQVSGVQFATQQSSPRQLLPDDLFGSLDFEGNWSVYGDAQVERRRRGRVIVRRGWFPITYEMLEEGFFFSSAYGNLDSRPYGEIEGGLSHSGMAEGGVTSIPVSPSGSGRLYVAARVSAADTGINAPVLVELVSTEGNEILAQAERTLYAGETTDLWIGYTPGTVTEEVTYGEVETMGVTHADLEALHYSDLQALPIKGEVFARVRQVGETDDTFSVHRLSIFDDPIVWGFSVDGGVTWYDALDVRNNPHGVLNFPETGNQLRWRVRSFLPDAMVNALAIRPWYHGTSGSPPNHGMDVYGPNINVQDLLPPIELDPMWQQWDQPIPRWWFDEIPVDETVEDVPVEVITPPAPEPVRPYELTAHEELRNFEGVEDTFYTGSDGPLTSRTVEQGGQTWQVTGPGTFEVVFGAARAKDIQAEPTIAWVDGGAANSTWEITVESETEESGLAFRGSTPLGQNYWVATTKALYRCEAGVLTVVHTWLQPLASGALRVVTEGDLIEVYLGGQLLGTVTDAFNNTGTWGGPWAREEV